MKVFLALLSSGFAFAAEPAKEPAKVEALAASTASLDIPVPADVKLLDDLVFQEAIQKKRESINRSQVGSKSTGSSSGSGSSGGDAQNADQPIPQLSGISGRTAIFRSADGRMRRAVAGDTMLGYSIVQVRSSSVILRNGGGRLVSVLVGEGGVSAGAVNASPASQYVTPNNQYTPNEYLQNPLPPQQQYAPGQPGGSGAR